MSQDLNILTATSKSSSSSNYANSLNAARSFNNNTNSFNYTTTNNVSSHFTVTEDRLEILAWISPFEPKPRNWARA